MQINDPLIAKIDLDTVQFVYLRKENGKSGASADDDLYLQRAVITMCDQNKKLRRFRLLGPIVFGDGFGQQHWIPEVNPPGCRVVVRLLSIIHQKAHKKHSAGHEWFFSFGANLAGGSPIYNLMSGQKQHILGDWETLDPRLPKVETFFVSGCCGQTIELDIFGAAREEDGLNDDHGSNSTRHSLKCGPTLEAQKHILKVYVNEGQKPSHASNILFEYEISTVCVP